MIKSNKGYLFKDREISWLYFNERVLQEAENPANPLMERIKFLAIFSSNLDEFFKVRVAQLRRVQRVNGKKAISDVQNSPDEILEAIQLKVQTLQDRFNKNYQNSILPSLAAKKIFLVNNNQIDEDQKLQVKNYFKTNIINLLFPIIIDDLRHTPHLRDRSIYLAVRLLDSKNILAPKHAIIEVPVGVLNRFYQLPTNENGNYIICLEDIIKLNLSRIFQQFNYDTFESYIIKITRDAEFTIDTDDRDYTVSLLDKIQKSIKQRSRGVPTRFVYDAAMPKQMLDFFAKKLELKNVNMVAGGMYHNFKDFMDFPKVGNAEDYYESLPVLGIRELDKAKILFDVIAKHDVLLHHPYQSFDYLIRLLREAAIDPNVHTIKITLYRVAKHSNVVNALINAIKNGKIVVVLMELQARFDEESNIYWTNQLQEAGAHVHFGKPGQKVHTKFCLIYRKENNQTVKYAHLSTGNYNGMTAKIYSDFAIFTKDERITNELEMISDQLFLNMKRGVYKHLLIAPDNMKRKFLEMIDTEISNKKAGKSAYIIAKMNSLVDNDVIKKLYDASRVGVKIQLIVRGVCALVPGVKGLSENIEVISIIDKFLEHARVYIFCNNGSEILYLASADWMSRNLTNRIECAFPIYNPEIKNTIKTIINLQLNDECKARRINEHGENDYQLSDCKNKRRSQNETYNYLKEIYKKVD
jgi:polyphosphate kinase